ALRRPVRALPGPGRITGGQVKARLGINTCFAVKRWPRPDDWARIVRDELGLEVVELSLDLIEDGDRRAVNQVRSALDEYGLRAETVFTGLAAYSLNLLMHPDQERRRAAADWYLGVVDLAARVGARGAGGHVGAMSVPDWSDPERRTRRTRRFGCAWTSGISACPARPGPTGIPTRGWRTSAVGSPRSSCSSPTASPTTTGRSRPSVTRPG